MTVRGAIGNARNVAVVAALFIGACHRDSARTVSETRARSPLPPVGTGAATAPPPVDAPSAVVSPAAGAVVPTAARSVVVPCGPGCWSLVPSDDCPVQVRATESVDVPPEVRASGRMKDGYFVAEGPDDSGENPGSTVQRYYPMCPEQQMLTLSPLDRRIHVRFRGDQATLTGAGCHETYDLEDEEGPLVVWDPLAHACRTSAGNHPGGWAGCSQQCTDGRSTVPPTGQKCLTGSHWVCCDGCYCDGAKTYDRATHTCR
jgi:hypothetical protein